MLTIKYDGFGFHGWQKQEPPDAEPLRTAQGVIESATRRAVREPVNVMGASRTDSGVHAEAQVAAFTVEEPRIPVDRLHRAINRYLDEDIAVTAAREVPLDFEPTWMPDRKAYRYSIHNALLRPVFDRSRLYHFWYDLDLDRMNDAAGRLVGEHDFESFANTAHGRESTVRTVFACGVSRMGERVFIDIEGSGFLYHMVRIIAGTLVEIGRGHWAPEYIDEILESRDRRLAGPTLEARGLCLQWIHYPDEALRIDSGDDSSP